MTVRWPEIVIQGDKPIPEEAMESTLSTSDISVEYLNPPPDNVGIGRGGGWGDRWARRFVPGSDFRIVAWCGCCEDTPLSRRPPSGVLSKHAVYVPRPDIHLSSVARISLNFHKPVEEPFEAVSEPVR